MEQIEPTIFENFKINKLEHKNSVFYRISSLILFIAFFRIINDRPFFSTYYPIFIPIIFFFVVFYFRSTWGDEIVFFEDSIGLKRDGQLCTTIEVKEITSLSISPNEGISFFWTTRGVDNWKMVSREGFSEIDWGKILEKIEYIKKYRNV